MAVRFSLVSGMTDPRKLLWHTHAGFARLSVGDKNNSLPDLDYRQRHTYARLNYQRICRGTETHKVSPPM